jgi:hypothetical protein
MRIHFTSVAAMLVAAALSGGQAKANMGESPHAARSQTSQRMTVTAKSQYLKVPHEVTPLSGHAEPDGTTYGSDIGFVQHDSDHGREVFVAGTSAALGFAGAAIGSVIGPAGTWFGGIAGAGLGAGLGSLAYDRWFKR